MIFFVSIHAPARGATEYQKQAVAFRTVSIHAPARGATFSAFFVAQIVSRFQFTHPRGVRPRTGGKASGSDKSFNSRTREGCDGLCGRQKPLGACFNSRTREGCDAFDGGAGGWDRVSFNSRTREGCDPLNVLEQASVLFQFTHPRGVRLHAFFTLPIWAGFQFTHPRGVRLEPIKTPSR